MPEGRKISIFAVWTAGLAFSLAAIAGPARADERAALVIGNADYAHAPALTTTVNDASDIGAALERLGFAVTRVENADQAALLRSLRALAAAAEGAEAVVVFYAGHGVSVDERNFLLPTDARLSSEQDLELEAIPLELILRAVERARGVRVIILDASRENPFVSSMRKAGAKRSIGRGLARPEPSRETLVAFASKAGTVALEGRGRNSLYSEALLRHLEDPDLDVGQMLRKVHEAVLGATGGSQEPSVYGSLPGERVYLGPPPSRIAEAPDTARSAEDEPGLDRLSAERLRAERLYWESVKDSSDPAEIQTYLDQYPNGTYAALARVRLERLKRRGGLLPAGAVSASEEVAETGPAPDPEAAEEALDLRREDRRIIQSGLAALGFDPGPVDGLFGRGTRAAIGKWQHSKGRPATGFLDAVAAEALAKAGIAAPPPPSERRKSSSGLPKAAAATLSKALKTAGKIDDPGNRGSVFARISDVFMEAGEARRAKQSLELALTAAEGALDAGDSGLLPYNLTTILTTAAKVGDADWSARTMARALAIATRIEDEDDRAKAISTIAEAQAEVGDAEGARQSIERALATAARIEDEDERDWAFRYTSEAQAEAGDIPGALATAARIEDEDDRAGAISGIARAQAAAGDAEGARRSIEQALATAARIEDEDERAWEMGTIAGVQAKAGDIPGALATAARVEDEWPQALALKYIAGTQAEAGDVEGARRSIERALATTARIEDEFQRALALGSIAEAQAGAGYIPEALATAGRIEDEDERAEAMRDIAHAQAESGDIPGALATATRIEVEDERTDAISGIAKAQVEAGDAEGARRSIEQALATAARIEDERERAWEMREIAGVQAKAGDIPEALATAARIEVERFRAYAYSAIALAQIQSSTR